MLTRLPKVLMAAVPGCLLLSGAMIALCASQSRARSIAAFCSTIPGKELRTGVSQPAGRQSTLEPQSYKIRIDFREPLRATVQAILTFPDGRLFTHEHAGGYEWSDFIKDIQATREDGSVIPIQSLGPGRSEEHTSELQSHV